MAIKAAFFDIDGTLVSFNTHTVPDSTIRAIDILRSHNIPLFISSGRHILSINNLGNLKFDGYVTINGAMTMVDGKVIHRNCIDKQDVIRANDYMEGGNSFPCTFVMDDKLVINYYNDVVDQILLQLNFPHIPQGNLRNLENENIYQMISFFSEETENEIMKQMPGCSSARWSPLFTDIVKKGTSKVMGMEKICEHFGINPDETIAFGDGGNDIEMLQWAGIGVAMGNAEDKVKAVADYITTSVDDNGIFNAVKHLMM